MVQTLWKTVWQFLKILKLPYDPAIPLQGHWKHMYTQLLSTNTHSSIIHSSTKVDPWTPMSMKWWMDKHNLLYPHSRILFSNTEEWSTDRCWNIGEPWKLGERSQSLSTLCYVVPLMSRSRIGIHRDQKWIHGGEEMRWGGGWAGEKGEGKGSDCWWIWGFFLPWGKILELVTAAQHCKCTTCYFKRIVHFKWVNSVVCEIYLNKPI